MNCEFTLIQKQIITMLFFSNKRTHVSFLQFSLNISKEVFNKETLILKNNNILKNDGNFYILVGDWEKYVYNFLNSYKNDNIFFCILLHFINKEIDKMCKKSINCIDYILSNNKFIELRFFYDVLLYCFTKIHPSINDIDICKTFIDISYKILILFEGFPFILNKIRIWYIKVNALSYAINYNNPNYAISAASGFLFNSENVQDEFFFCTSKKKLNAVMWKNFSGEEVNIFHYLSIKYFLDGNFIKCINTVYNKDSESSKKQQFYSRTLYVSAAISAVYLGEYDIALEMLNIGISHAELQNNKNDIQTLMAVKSYVYVSKGEYKKSKEIAENIIKNKEEVITYGELWAVKALTCMYYRQNDLAASFDTYKKYLKKNVDDQVLHIGYIFSSLILEVMTSWENEGLGHPLQGNFKLELERAKQSASCMLRNIALRSEMILLAKKVGWQDQSVVSLLENCLRQARFINSPVQRAKGLLCAIQASLSYGDLNQARHYMEEVVDTSRRYGCPIIPQHMKFLLEDTHKGTISNLENDSFTVRDIPLGKESGFIVHSECMQDLLNKVSLLAPRDTSVLILGESGVGKEHIARKLHELSGRKGAFIAVNLSSIPSELFESEFYGHKKGSFTGASYEKVGLLELADGGTLFLDEVGDIPPHIQVKLLRVLQEKNFIKVGGTKLQGSDFRIISATNKNLEEAVKNETFREDLYYRVNVFSLRIPPLRDRQHDVIFIAEYFLELFLKKYNLPKKRFSSDDLRFLTSYSWPGNVRELKNYIERYVFSSDYEHTIDRSRLLNNSNYTDEKNLEEDYKRHEENNIFLDNHFMPVQKIIQNYKTKNSHLPTLEEVKNNYIEYVYSLTNGIIPGDNGMANILGVSKVTAYTWVEKLKLKDKYRLKMVRYRDSN